MKVNFAIIALLLILGTATTYYLDSKTNKQSSYIEIKDFDVELLSGKISSFSKIANNKDIIIHFWATWCTPCLVELPELIKMADENNKDIRVLAIAVQDDVKKINAFFEKNNIHIPQNVEIGLDSNKNISQNIFSTQKLPESFYLNQYGQTLARHNGAIDNWRTSSWITEFMNKNSE